MEISQFIRSVHLTQSGIIVSLYDALCILLIYLLDVINNNCVRNDEIIMWDEFFQLVCILAFESFRNIIRRIIFIFSDYSIYRCNR